MESEDEGMGKGGARAPVPPLKSTPVVLKFYSACPALKVSKNSENDQLHMHLL